VIADRGSGPEESPEPSAAIIPFRDRFVKKTPITSIVLRDYKNPGKKIFGSSRCIT
jgi:hypothetical protein